MYFVIKLPTIRSILLYFWNSVIVFNIFNDYITLRWSHCAICLLSLFLICFSFFVWGWVRWVGAASTIAALGGTHSSYTTVLHRSWKSNTYNYKKIKINWQVGHNIKETDRQNDWSPCLSGDAGFEYNWTLETFLSEIIVFLQWRIEVFINIIVKQVSQIRLSKDVLNRTNES